MRAIQIVDLTGPTSALRLVDLPPPASPPSHLFTPGEGVTIDVHAAGVSFPEVLQTRGEYQYKPPLPFVPGGEVAGVVREASGQAAALGVSAGDRVAAFCMSGGFAETAVAPPFLTFLLPDVLDFAQGAGLILNYHTAYFALALRGRLREGETVLVHGAAGGVGTAVLQVAAGLGARTIAVVSSEEKALVARAAGADEVLRSDGPWKDEAKELSGGGVDVVLDPVGGDRFTDSLRSLRPDGRLVVVGFTGGVDPRGQSQPAAALQCRGGGRRLGRLCASPAGALPRDRRTPAAADRARVGTPDPRRPFPAGARRRRARGNRRTPRHGQGRARHPRRRLSEMTSVALEETSVALEETSVALEETSVALEETSVAPEEIRSRVDSPAQSMGGS